MKSLFVILTSFAMLMPATAGQAAEEGQADLDQATELKLTANSLDDLDQVVTLCESAIEKGLNDGSREFAKQLLTSTLYQHATQLCAPIFEAQQPDPRWPVLRKFAVRDLEKALTHDEKLGDVHLLLAKLMLLPGGDRQRAVRAVDSAVKHLAEDRDQLVDALVLRARLTGEPDDRIADLTRALKFEPTNVDALKTRGALYLTQGQVEEALADFEQVLVVAPEDITAWEAVAELLASQEKFDAALEKVNEAIKQNPERVTAYVIRARIHAMQENMEESLADLNTALEADAENLAALLFRARVYQTQDEFAKAKADIDAALKIRPDLSQAIVLQSLNAAASGNMNEAIISMRRALAIDPQNTQWRTQLAAYYVADERPRAAIKVYDDLISQDADNALALRGRGDAYLSIGKHKQAVADLKAALEKTPEDSGILNNLAWVLSTTPNDEVRDPKLALKLAKKATEVTEYKAPHIVSTLAAAYAVNGMFEEAVKWSQKSIEMATSDEMKKQLAPELEHYKEGKRYEELQQTEENTTPLKYGPGEFEL